MIDFIVSQFHHSLCEPARCQPEKHPAARHRQSVRPCELVLQPCESPAPQRPLYAEDDPAFFGKADFLSAEKGKADQASLSPRLDGAGNGSDEKDEGEKKCGRGYPETVLVDQREKGHHPGLQFPRSCLAALKKATKGGRRAW